MLLIDKTGITIVGFIACILHESGHIISYLIIKKRPENISFEATGIALTKPSDLISFKKELFIISAGCFVNFALFLIFYRINPVFSLSNLTICFFNLLPILSLDGGKIIYTLLCLHLSPYTSEKIVKIISVLTVTPLILLGCTVFLQTKNITLIITSLYLLSLLIIKSQD